MDSKNKYKTEQREKLITFLKAHANEQLSMRDILDAMTAQGVGESTVYRLIKELVESGEVRRFVVEHNRRFYYQAVRDISCGHHVHLKCVGCGKLIHLSGFVSDFIHKQIEATHHFALDEQLTMFYGKCATCQK
ncbi:MAG: transcriptional repressor [Clostridia bacterium]|nr:transcriptional repressor [Clostridia bacterium]